MVYKVNSQSLIRNLVLLSFIFCSLVSHAEATQVDCDDEFIKILGDSYYADLEHKILKLERLSSFCKGTGIYESRLGGFYLSAGRIDDSEKIVKSGLVLKSRYTRELRLSLVDIDTRKGDLERAEKGAQKLIEDFPIWSASYVSMGKIYLIENRYFDAVAQLEKAKELEEGAGVYSLLVVAYYNAGNDIEAVRAMQSAVKISKDTLYDADVVCAGALALTKLEFYKAARELMQRHLGLRPEAAANPQYQTTLVKIKRRMSEVGAN